jgi:hypothetical protein
MVENLPSQILLKAKNSEPEKEVPVKKGYCEDSLLIFDVQLYQSKQVGDFLFRYCMMNEVSFNDQKLFSNELIIYKYIRATTEIPTEFYKKFTDGIYRNSKGDYEKTANLKILKIYRINDEIMIIEPDGVSLIDLKKIFSEEQLSHLPLKSTTLKGQDFNYADCFYFESSKINCSFITKSTDSVTPQKP